MKKNPASLAYLEYVVSFLNEANIPVFPHHIPQSDTIDSARLLGKPAVSLPNATLIRDGYLANARYLISKVKEFQSASIQSPDLAKLGLIKQTLYAKEESEMKLNVSKRIAIEF